MGNDKGQGQNPPHEFHIQIDRVHFPVTAAIMTGLELRGLPSPPIGQDRDLFEVVPGHPDRKVENDTSVEISDGKRFFTAPSMINPGLDSAKGSRDALA